MSKKTYSAGVKEYRDTYWMPEYTPKDKLKSILNSHLYN